MTRPLSRRGRLYRPRTRPLDSYLSMSTSIISAAELTNADGIPSRDMAFSAENADFAEQVEKSGFTFHRPHRRLVIRSMGDKVCRHAARCKLSRRAH